MLGVRDCIHPPTTPFLLYLFIFIISMCISIFIFAILPHFGHYILPSFNQSEIWAFGHIVHPSQFILFRWGRDFTHGSRWWNLFAFFCLYHLQAQFRVKVPILELWKKLNLVGWNYLNLVPRQVPKFFGRSDILPRPFFGIYSKLLREDRIWKR